MAKVMSVADFLSRAIELSGKTQKMIADEIGYPKPNVISMMRLGQTKVPIDKIPALSKATGVDPANFLRLAMREYNPAVWDCLEEIFGIPVTEHEKKFLALLREADPEGIIVLDTMKATKVKDALRDP